MTDHATPVSEADRQARAVFVAEAKRRGSYAAIADRFEVSPATCRAIFKGQRDVPPGLARAIAADLRAATIERHHEVLADRAAQLELWAEECAERNRP